MSMRMSKKEKEALVLNVIQNELLDNRPIDFLYSIKDQIAENVTNAFDAVRDRHGFLDDEQVDKLSDLTEELQGLAEPLLHKAIDSRLRSVKTKKPRKRRR